MTLIPPFGEDEKNLQDVIDHNETKGDWDVSIPYPAIVNDPRPLSRGLKHAERLAIRGAAIVSDLLKRN